MTRDERRERQLAEDIAVERIVQALLLVPEEDADLVVDRATALARVRRADREGDIARMAMMMVRDGGQS